MPSPSPSPQSGRGSGRGADDVELTDLEIIRRYSLAVRQDVADRAEVLAALRADLDRLAGSSRPRTPATTTRPSPQAAAKTPAKRSAKRAPAAKRTTGG
jgi:hypothetical protein